MLALLVFSYACCGIGVWFGWYLRGRRDRRRLFGVRGKRNADGSMTHSFGGNTAGTLITTGKWTVDWSPEAVAEFFGRTVTAQDSTE